MGGFRGLGASKRWLWRGNDGFLGFRASGVVLRLREEMCMCLCVYVCSLSPPRAHCHRFSKSALMSRRGCHRKQLEQKSSTLTDGEPNRARQ